jgi:hypothetical protein
MILVFRLALGLLVMHIGVTVVGAVGMARQAPGCDPPVWGNEAATFATRLEAYVSLRNQLETNPGRPATRQALAERIRTARAKAKPGDLLTPALSLEIKKSLRRELDEHTWKVIMDDNPGELPSQVNDVYREGMPLSTMPPNILAPLPRLAAGIEYRFVERHLVLLDTRAMVILDRIPYAIPVFDSKTSCR